MRNSHIHIGVVTVVILSVCIFSGCSKQRSNAGPAGVSLDSTHVSDTSAQSVAGNTDSLLSYEEREGRVVYTKYCAVCHGDDGKGDGFNAFNLDPKPRDFSDGKYMDGLSDERMMQTISGGGRSVNRSALMPSWGGRLNKREIEFVIAYVRKFSSQQ